MMLLNSLYIYGYLVKSNQDSFKYLENKMNNKKLYYKFLLAIFFINIQSLSFDKVILWGHKLHSHTHSFIHWGFYRAFSHLGYKTYWFDKDDNTDSFDFSNSLFITEAQADTNIPLRNDCFYVLHNCDKAKYDDLINKNKCIFLQVYTHDVLERNVTLVENLIFTDIKERTIYMPWATDLLPHEIEAIKIQIQTDPPIKTDSIYWLGSVGGGKFGNDTELEPLLNACKRKKINFTNIYCKATMEENIRLIQKSIIAPAIVGAWQKEKGYIPCRIFKNISYGQMGATNSKTVYDLFEGKIIYESDTEKLFEKAYNWSKNPNPNQLFELMDLVKEKHTYINRIEHLLNFLTIIVGA